MQRELEKPATSPQRVPLEMVAVILGRTRRDGLESFAAPAVSYSCGTFSFVLVTFTEVG
jgi:hypothetical protein